HLFVNLVLLVKVFLQVFLNLQRPQIFSLNILQLEQHYLDLMRILYVQIIIHLCFTKMFINCFYS
ncbi:hypothetical protein Mgra_00001827, partial [Meloidogyne graminicola]